MATIGMATVRQTVKMLEVAPARHCHTLDKRNSKSTVMSDTGQENPFNSNAWNRPTVHTIFIEGLHLSDSVSLTKQRHHDSLMHLHTFWLIYTLRLTCSNLSQDTTSRHDRQHYGGYRTLFICRMSITHAI